MLSRCLISILLFWAGLFAPIALAVQSAPVQTEHVEASLVSRYTHVYPGQSVTVALRLKIKPEWHTYWQFPGDSGLPTKIKWDLPTGFQAEFIRWPYPRRLPIAPLMNFGYEKEAWHLVNITAPVNVSGDIAPFKAKANWLVCSESTCIPESGELSLALPLASRPLKEVTEWQAGFRLAESQIPLPLKEWEARANHNGTLLTISLSGAAGLTPAPLQQLEFFPLRVGQIRNAAPQKLSHTATGYQLEIEADQENPAASTLNGVLVSTVDGRPHAHSINIPITMGAPPTSVPISNVAKPVDNISFLGALLFAFMGGLILNLMPCVFPVLTIKVMSFVKQAQQTHHEDRAKHQIRAQGIAFLAGVEISFLLLAGLLIALRAQGEALGWGFQLQSPVFVSALAALFLLMALNLWGVFEFGLGLQRLAGGISQPKGNNPSRRALVEAFMTGVLATIVATPCTAPFLGAALGFTLAQPVLIALPVFLIIGLGMALPVVILSWFPAWLRYLPKPGPWMETFKQAMAFPLMATVVGLAWVLSGQLENDALLRPLLGLVVLALAAWCYGRWQAGRPRTAIITGLLLLIVAVWTGMPDTQPVQQVWEPYSREKVESLRQSGKGIFIDFTASWCISCQVNKRVALQSDSVKARFKEMGITLIRADWTRQDPAITAALAAYGRNGVPLYLYFPATGGPPRILPEILTPEIVLSALR